MKFHLIADTHCKTAPDHEDNQNLALALQDMKAFCPQASAFAIAGDAMQDGYGREFANLYSMLDKHNPLEQPDVGTFICLGNHEVRGGYYAPGNQWIPDTEQEGSLPTPYYKTAYNLYMEYNRKYMSDTQGKICFDHWIDGYHFIAMNPDNGLKDMAYFSPEQLEWLEEKLAEDANDDKPIFVISHWPLRDTYYNSNMMEGFGHQDAKVKEIFSKYPQVVYITGHLHTRSARLEIQSRPFGTMVNTPCFQSSLSGYVVQVEENRISLKARNYIEKTWLPEHDFEIQWPSLPVLVAKAKKAPPCEKLIGAIAEAEEIMTMHYENNWEKDAPRPELFYNLPDTKQRIERLRKVFLDFQGVK